jgi:hypothetical protein
MTINSPVASALLVFFAVLGVLAVLAVLGIAGMHLGMMGMMGGNMTEACLGMMNRN